MAGQVNGQAGHEPLGIERSHAARPRGGDRLAIGVVHHVAACEHARDRGLWRAGLDLIDTVTGAASHIETDGAFVAIGHAPATELFKGALAMDPSGYLLVEPGTPNTAIPGVFACGDVMDPVYRQAVTAAGTGCMAALDAERFLAEREFEALKEAQAAE